MINETITLNCEAFGFLDLDVTYELVEDDHTFDHEFGTEKRLDSYAVVYSVKLNDKPITLTKDQLKELDDFITEYVL